MLEPRFKRAKAHVHSVDLPRWYVPHISRAESIGNRQRTGLQSPPYVGLIAGLTLTIWLVAIGTGTGLIVYAMFTRNLRLNQIGPVGFFLCMLAAWLLRAFVLLFIEAHLLYEIVGERQYYRWASTFSGVDPDKFAIVSGSQQLSYQYRPWWLAVVVLLGGVALVVPGCIFPVMLWATVPGAALVVETILRFGLELLWLRTPLGTYGRRIRLRWLPWLTISIRQY